MNTAFQHRGYIVRVQPDPDPMDPREQDQVTKMAFFHNRYRLGDRATGYSSADYRGWAQMADAIRKQEKPALMKPVYMYDHSGLTISTKPFSCPWDSGQIGFCWITKDRAQSELGIRRATVRNSLKLDKVLEAEIEQYDQFLRGEVYGIIIVNPDGVEIDSSWSYGPDDVKDEKSYAVLEGFQAIDGILDNPAETPVP